MVHLSLSCVFLDVCLVFLASKQVSCVPCVSSYVGFVADLSGFACGASGAWTYRSFVRHYLWDAGKVGQAWQQWTANSFPETETEKFSGGQYPWWNMMLHYSSTYYFPALQKAFLTLKVSLFFPKFLPRRCPAPVEDYRDTSPCWRFFGDEIHGSSMGKVAKMRQVYNRHLWNIARAERFAQAFQVWENHRKTMEKWDKYT